MEKNEQPVSEKVKTDSELDATIDTKPGSPVVFGASMVSSAAAPRLLGGYEILDEIARGGMGIVYRARQVKADRIVALKLVRSLDPDPKELARFQVEARAAAKLSHPHIVPVYDVGEIQGEAYFSMKLIEGESLAARIGGKPLAMDFAASIVLAVAEAIQYAHQNGVIHRDLKPSNILLDGNRQPHVTDFGLAKLSDKQSEITADGQTVGTPAYMSPEQSIGTGNLVDERSDVYSLGAVLYTCLTGRAPFLGASSAATIMQLLTREAIPPRQLNLDVDRDLETICLKCLEKDRQHRYGTAAELAADLGRYILNQPILARPVSTSERLKKWASRNPLVATLSGISILAIAALLVGSTIYQRQLFTALTETQSERQKSHSAESERAAVLYDSLVSQAAFLNQTRPVGYGKSTWQAIDQARQLDTPARDENFLRQLAVSSLGRPSFDTPVGLNGLGLNDARINVAEVAPNDRHIFVGLQSGEIVIFDRSTKNEVARHPSHSQAVLGIRFPDAQTCYTFTAFCREVHKWQLDGETWKPVGNVDTHCPAGVADIRLSRDGRYIVSWTLTAIADDATQLPLIEYPLGIYDFSEKSFFCIRPLEDDGEKIHLTNVRATASFDFDNRYLAAYNTDGKIRIYDLESAKVIREIPTACGGEVLLIDPQGKYLACGNHTGGHLVSIETGEEIAKLSQHECHLYQISPDSQSIQFVESNKQKIYLLATRSIETEMTRNMKHEASWYSRHLRLTLDTETNQVSFVNALSSQCLLLSTNLKAVDDAVFSADGTTLAISGDLQPLQIRDVTTGRLLGELPDATRATFHPSGKMVVVSCDARLDLYRLPELTRISSLPIDIHHFNRLRFDPSGKFLLCYGWERSRLAVYRINSSAPDFEDATLETMIQPVDGYRSADWSPDGATLAWVMSNQTETEMHVHWQTIGAENPNINRFASKIGERHCSIVIPRSDCVCLISSDGHLQSWNPQKGELIRQSTTTFRSPICKSPDGNFLLSQHKVIAVDTLETVFELPTFAGQAWGVDWSPTGKHVAISYAGGTVAIWDLESVRATVDKLRLAWDSLGFQDLKPLQPLEQLRQTTLTAKISQPAGIKWLSAAEFSKSIGEIKREISYAAWTDRLKRIVLTKDSDLAELRTNVAWVAENAPASISDDMTVSLLLYIHGVTTSFDTVLTPTEYEAWTKSLLEHFDALPEPSKAVNAVRTLFYTNYADWLDIDPSRREEALMHHAKAENIAWELVKSKQIAKHLFGQDWFWMFARHAFAQKVAGNRVKAIELITEAIDSAEVERAISPDEKFLLECRRHLETWVREQSQPVVEMSEEIVPQDVATETQSGSVTKQLLRPPNQIDSWIFMVHENAKGAIQRDGDAISFTTITPGLEAWHVQAVQLPIAFKEGAEYVVRLEIRSPESRTVAMHASIEGGDWHYIGLAEQLKTTTEFQVIERRFLAKDISPINRLCFDMGDNPGTVVIKNMTLEEVKR